MPRQTVFFGIKVGSRLYRTHGVRSNGNFCVLPYMNDADASAKSSLRAARGCQRIDLLADAYLTGKMSYDGLLQTVSEKRIVNIPAASMHVLASDAAGRILLIEPEISSLEIHDRFAVISNFPTQKPVPDLSPAYYGKDRYDKAVKALQQSGADFCVADALELLRQVRQEGERATRVSFVYSERENAVYYACNSDFFKYSEAYVPAVSADVPCSAAAQQKQYNADRQQGKPQDQNDPHVFRVKLERLHAPFRRLRFVKDFDLLPVVNAVVLLRFGCNPFFIGLAVHLIGHIELIRPSLLGLSAGLVCHRRHDAFRPRRIRSILHPLYECRNQQYNAGNAK